MVYALTEVSMGQYHYYPRTLYTCPKTDGFTLEPESPTRSARLRWGCAGIVAVLAALGFLLLR